MSDVFTRLFSPDDKKEGRLYGVVFGIVTNNKDPEGLGRVKVKLPWMADELESNWARVVTPMAGAQRGIYFLPEVDDEVLVAFEHGSAEHPYVLGALWNGKDKPPESNSDGKNNTRTIRSRSGHVIRLTDTAGEKDRDHRQERQEQHRDQRQGQHHHHHGRRGCNHPLRARQAQARRKRGRDHLPGRHQDRGQPECGRQGRGSAERERFGHRSQLGGVPWDSRQRNRAIGSSATTSMS